MRGAAMPKSCASAAAVILTVVVEQSVRQRARHG
jgi:hypothetical protein